MSKLINFFKNSKKRWIIIFLIFEVIFVSLAWIITPKIDNEIHSYPSEDYKNIEEEVEKIIETKDFTSTYEYTFCNNIEENIYVFEMEGKEGAYITAKITNFGKEDEDVFIERKVENEDEYVKQQTEHIESSKKLKKILSFIMGTAMSTCWVVLVESCIDNSEYSCRTKKIK